MANEVLRQREYYDRRLSALTTERASWFTHWREISDYLIPRRGRFLVTDRNDGSKKNQKIIDNTGTIALRILASGMMTGITSPARPWFRLSTPDRGLLEFQPVKVWLDTVEEIMRQVFHASNLYKVLPVLYSELGAFGTGVMAEWSDFEDVARFRVYTAGEYYLACNSRMDVDTVYREYSSTVSQVVNMFGIERCSRAVKDAYDKGNYDDWVDCVHVIEPKENMSVHPEVARVPHPWVSVYYDKGDEDRQLLAVEGYNEFPVFATRWTVLNPDVYGRSPGMDVLGDVKQLQIEQKRKAQAIDKMVNPPMQGPASLMHRPKTVLPGGVTYVDQAAGQGFKPAYEVNPRIEALLADIQEVQNRINRGLYADLFQAMLLSDRRMVTATEVAEKHEEKLLALSPLLESIHSDCLRPLIDRTFNIMLRAGILPDPPQELQGMKLDVEFISLLAQAQQQVGTSSIERVAGFVGNLAAVNPDALDKIDFDSVIDHYSEMLGVPAEMIRSERQVAELRAQRQQAQAQQMQAEQAATAAQAALPAAQAAKVLSETEVSGQTVLDQMANLRGPR